MTDTVQILDCNHEFVEQTVRTEVIHLLTPMVQFAFKNGLEDEDWQGEIYSLMFPGDDWETPVREHMQDMSREQLLAFIDWEDEADVSDETIRAAIRLEYSNDWARLGNDLDVDCRVTEIYEYWAVSDRLAHWLKEKDEHVVGLLGFNVWGRQTTGQSITLDHVIRLIATEWHNRLSGQEG